MVRLGKEPESVKEWRKLKGKNIIRKISEDKFNAFPFGDKCLKCFKVGNVEEVDSKKSFYREFYPSGYRVVLEDIKENKFYYLDVGAVDLYRVYRGDVRNNILGSKINFR